MKVLVFSILSLCLILAGCAPQSRPTKSAAPEAAGRESGGGSADTAEFEQIAKALARAFSSQKPKTVFGVTGETLTSITREMRVEAVAKTLQKNGAEVQALNYPSERRIEFNVDSWREIRFEKKVLLVIHEILGLLRQDDEGYTVSSRILSELARSYEGDWEEGFKHALFTGSRAGTDAVSREFSCSVRIEARRLSSGDVFHIAEDWIGTSFLWKVGDRSFAIDFLKEYVPFSRQRLVSQETFRTAYRSDGEIRESGQLNLLDDTGQVQEVRFDRAFTAKEALELSTSDSEPVTTDADASFRIVYPDGAIKEVVALKSPPSTRDPNFKVVSNVKVCKYKAPHRVTSATLASEFAKLPNSRKAVGLRKLAAFSMLYENSREQRELADECTRLAKDGCMRLEKAYRDTAKERDSAWRALLPRR